MKELKTPFYSIVLSSLALLVFSCGKSEKINRPGHEIEIKVDEIRSLRSKMILGLQPLWYPEKITFKAYPFVTDGDTVEWQPKNVKTNSDEINLNLPIDKQRATGAPIWYDEPVIIKFDLIDDDRLVGKILKGHVNMVLKVGQVNGEPIIININKDLQFKVASKDEIEAYEASWFSRGVKKIFTTIGIIIGIIVLLFFAKSLLPKYS